MVNGIKPPKASPGAIPASPPAPSMAKPSAMGKQGVAVKMPKAKKIGDAFAPPSVFFGKTEGLQEPKHPNLTKLLDFIKKKHKNTK